MKMTAFALAGIIGGFGAIGLTNFAGVLAVPASNANPSRASIPVRASPAKLPPVCQRNSRRVRPQNWVGGMASVPDFQVQARDLGEIPCVAGGELRVVGETNRGDP